MCHCLQIRKLAEQRSAIKFCVKIEKNGMKITKLFKQLIEMTFWVEEQCFNRIRRFKERKESADADSWTGRPFRQRNERLYVQICYQGNDGNILRFWGQSAQKNGSSGYKVAKYVYLEVLWALRFSIMTGNVAQVGFHPKPWKCPGPLSHQSYWVIDFCTGIFTFMRVIIRTESSTSMYCYF